MAEKKQVKSVQKKKKKWYPVFAPKVFREMIVGETPADDDLQVIGRTLKVNMMTLVRDPKRQNFNMMFKITGIKENRAESEIYGFDMVPSSIRRLVKRRKEKVDDSFVCRTKDDKVFHMKTLVITNGPANNSTLATLRRKVRYFVSKRLSEVTFEEFINSLVGGKFLSELRDEVRKIYPPKIVEIRSMRMAPGKKPIDPENFIEIKVRPSKSAEKKSSKKLDIVAPESQ